MCSGNRKHKWTFSMFCSMLCGSELQDKWSFSSSSPTDLTFRKREVELCMSNLYWNACVTNTNGVMYCDEKQLYILLCSIHFILLCLEMLCRKYGVVSEHDFDPHRVVLPNYSLLSVLLILIRLLLVVLVSSICD